ncbi:MAG: S8 family serine peptidase [Bacteroidales bacterium]|nr:S8 family serine peptidase [Bacteroidales bacterium]
MRRLIYSLITALFLTNYCVAQSNVIEKELQEVLNQKKGEKISINIILKSQLETEYLNERSKDTDRNIKREIIVNELKTFSEKNQQDIISILYSEEKKGNVTDIRSHWLSNSISCNATSDIINKLSQREEIFIIGYNQDRPAIMSDEQAEEVKAEVEITDNVVKINAPEVWEQGYTGENVLVAILDTGVNYEHPDLADHLWDGGTEYPNHGYNAYDGSNNTMDARGHGTHCAGTICGDGTLGKQTGVAPNATLMCVKTLNDEGSTNANAICTAMEFAVEHGADVLSMSLGIEKSSVSDRTMIRQTCVNTLAAGIVASVAVGNEGGSMNVNPVPDNVRVPGSCPAPWIHEDQQVNAGETSCVVAVGAVNNYDNVASYSSRGPVTWQETSFADYPYNPGIGLIRPDVCAPGTDIVSLDYSKDGYVKMTGTSMAAPCVAGVMCLMLSKDPTLTPAEISMILETSSVKLSDNKNNETGSGRVDALAAINAIDMGPLKYTEFSINDEEGNNNNQINPGEEVSINISFENSSSGTLNNITAKLTCKNEWVNITQANTLINSISANGSVTLENAFTLSLDEDAISKNDLYFDVEFYDGNNKISTSRFITTISGSTIRYSSITIENDDNGNGILTPEETADLRIFINNEGNEIALGLTGVLSCNNNAITINNTEAEFGNIAPDGSASALFNVSIGEVGGVSHIPLSLVVKDKFNRTKVFDINYEFNCEVTYVLKDEFGDGWNGAEIIAHYSDGSEDDTYTITAGYDATFTKTLASGVDVSLEWKNGGVDTECSYIISYDNGTEIFSGKGRQQGTFLSWIYDCSCQTMPIENCDAVKNFRINVNNNSIELKWDAPDTEGVVHYEVYRDIELIATTTELSYLDENLNSGNYVYNVRAVYEDCYGEISGGEVNFTVDVKENKEIKAEIYPNPSNDRFIVRCENMTEITVVNVLGEIILKSETTSDTFSIDNFESGIYFVNIRTEEGSLVRKIVKY